MPPSHHTDEPHIIKPTGPNYRLYGAIAFIVVLVGLLAWIPLFEHWQHEQAHDTVRGKLEGAVYDIQIDGKTERMELGWAGAHLAILLDEPPPPGTTVHIKGDFGEEVLNWNDEYSLFGPTQADISPLKHQKVAIQIVADDGRVLWSGKRWAWGIVSGHDHHH